MIRLVYSNRTEELLAALCEDVGFHRSRPGSNVFESTHLVVPHRHIDAHVKAGLATRAGIAYNIRTHLLTELLPDLLEGAGEVKLGGASGASGGAVSGRPVRLRVLDQPALRGLLLSALLAA